MRIGINGSFLNAGNTGIGIILRAYLKEFAKCPQHEFVIFMDTPCFEDFIIKSDNVMQVSLPVNNFLPRFLAKAHFQRSIEKALHQHKCDILWSPFPTITRPKHIKHLITVHDVIPYTDKRYIRLRTKAYNRAVIKNFKKATALHFVSDSAKADFEEFLPKNHTHKAVVKNAITVPAQTHIPSKFHLPRPFLFYIGGYDPRKNIRLMLESFREVADETNLDLVLGGKPPKTNRVAQNPMEIVKEVLPPSLQGRVHLTGLISEEEKFAFYRGAEGFVHLSEAEGFNLPVLEAISVGTPALISDIPVNHEVGGEAAYYVDLKNPVPAFRDFALNPKCDPEIMAAQAEKFSFERSGQKMIRLFEKI